MGEDLGIVGVVIVVIILIVSQWLHRKRQLEIIEMFTADLEDEADENADGRTDGDGRVMDESDLVDDELDLVDDQLDPLDELDGSEDDPTGESRP